MKTSITMNKLIIFLFLFCVPRGTFAQSFDDAKSRYEHDSDFAVKTDTLSHTYVDITPSEIMGITYDKIYFSVYCDYDTQPYEVWPIRDTVIVDSGTRRLPPVIGTTQSLAGQFVFTGNMGSDMESISVNNINSTAYEAYAAYGIKFLFWYFCDKYNKTIN